MLPGQDSRNCISTGIRYNKAVIKCLHRSFQGQSILVVNIPPDQRSIGLSSDVCYVEAVRVTETLTGWRYL